MKKDDILCFLYFLLVLLVLATGAYLTYIEWSNKFMLNEYLKNEVKK